MIIQDQTDLYGLPPEFRRDRLQAAYITSLVALAVDLPAREIAAHTRKNQAVTRARQLAIYLAHVTLSWPLARAAFAFGRDRTTASTAVRTVEELRDDPAMDARIAELETCVRQAPGAWEPVR
jgi:chromosomal replication initiation ATPase DnaA